MIASSLLRIPKSRCLRYNLRIWIDLKNSRDASAIRYPDPDCRVAVPPPYPSVQKVSNQTCFFSTVSSDTHREILEENKQKVRELLDESILPRGSFKPSHGIEIKHLLDFFKNEKQADAETVNLVIGLIERMVVERETSNGGVESKWICKPMYYSPLINLWKEAAKRGEDVIPPFDLVQKLLKMSRMHADFRYDEVIINMILDVVIKREPPQRAPLVAEHLLEFVRKEAAETQSVDLLPDLVKYNMVLQAWAVSGLPQVPQKLNELIYTMHEEGIAPGNVTYTILLRYWGGLGAVKEVEAILAAMKGEGLERTRSTLTQAVYCYAKNGNTEKAEELLEEMISLEPNDQQEDRMIGQSLQNILLAYRKIVEDPNSPLLQKEKAVERSEALFNTMSVSSLLNDDESARLLNTMTDIYVRAGKHDRVAIISQRLQLNAIQLGLVIKSLGMTGNAERATAILENVLKESHAEPTIETFNTLINTWAESSRPDTVEKAYAILRLLSESPRCVQLGLRPDTITFSTLLKCLSKSGSKDSGTKSIEILDEMERRYEAGDNNVKPNEICYNLAIKTLLANGDTDRAKAILERMKKSDTPPSVRTYNDVLHHWSKVGTPGAAKRNHKILMSLRQLAKTKDPALRPDVYAYNNTLFAWSRSGHFKSGTRMWGLFEQMKDDNIEPSSFTFTILINFFALSKRRRMLERADTLLQFMENSPRPDILPNHTHFVPVIKGWRSFGNMDKATQVLMRRVDAYVVSKNEAAKPNPDIMDYVLNGWLEAGDPERATAFIAEMQRLRDQAVLPEGPSLRSYNTLLLVWKKSSHPERRTYIQNIKESILIIERQYPTSIASSKRSTRQRTATFG